MKTIPDGYSQMRYLQVISRSIEHENRDYVKQERQELLERVIAGLDHHEEREHFGRVL